MKIKDAIEWLKTAPETAAIAQHIRILNIALAFPCVTEDTDLAELATKNEALEAAYIMALAWKLAARKR